jgi:hypothetical protein
MKKIIILLGFCILFLGCDNNDISKELNLDNDSMHMQIGYILYSIGCDFGPDNYLPTHYDPTYCFEQGGIPTAFKEWNYKTNTGIYDVKGVPFSKLT